MKTIEETLHAQNGNPGSFESDKDLDFVLNGHLFRLPGPLKAIASPDGTYHIQFKGEGFFHKNVAFRGTVSFQEDGTVYGNLARGLTLSNTEPPRLLRMGAEVRISAGGMLTSKDTYLIEGDCTSKKCALSRDLNRDPISGEG